MQPASKIADRSSQKLKEFLRSLPKAELHVHIEGTLEPEMIFDLGIRNNIPLPYRCVEELREAFEFNGLQSFLDLYYAGARVLCSERDFFDMTWAYLQRAHSEGITHVEIMFDPQTHTERGIATATVFAGIASAMRQAKTDLGISGYLIMCFLRHLSQDAAFQALAAALPLRDHYRDLWLAVGLDSGERGNPPEKFAQVFEECRNLGFRLVAHAGEEGPAQYVRSALDVLNVERIDHGVRSEEDPDLLQRIIDEQIPLTVCPLSNYRLGVVDSMADHNVARLLRRGARVTINSDDPAYFGGYLLDNYLACAEQLHLSRAELMTLARNSIVASFLPDADKQRILASPNYAP